MRILRLIPYFADAFGGPVHHLKMITKELERLGHETVIYTSNLADKSGYTIGFYGNEFDVCAFPVRWSLGDYFYTPGMKAALQREDFDIVHAHCYRNYQAELAAWISRKTEKPLVFTAHGTLVKLPGVREKILKGVYDTIFRGLVLKRASRVIALSKGERNQYRSLSVPQEKIVSIYHGVDSNQFKPIDDGYAVREELGLGSGPVILFVGRIHRRKGLQYLLPAFARVLKEFPRATLLICGPDHGYRRDLLKLLAATSTSDNVVWTGEVEHSRMSLLYGASDIFVLPAQYEVFGHVLAEAAACGKAIVATRFGWVAEFFEDERECMLIDRYGDVAALAKALLTLLAEPDLRANLGARARAKVLQNLSWQRCAIQHINTYDQLLA